ncbi:hypothetical protein DL93DRAFT_2070480 [Clavulina sp. PMI_390]|nr:hypothetical protein DL93DRAFT_2070480 [Clavulina sp. PMI_390]
MDAPPRAPSRTMSLQDALRALDSHLNSAFQIAAYLHERLDAVTDQDPSAQAPTRVCILSSLSPGPT